MPKHTATKQKLTTSIPEKYKFDARDLSLGRDFLIDTLSAAELLNIPANTLRKWRCTGENDIPFIKIGRHVKYRTSDLRAYIEIHTIQGGK